MLVVQAFKSCTPGSRGWQFWVQGQYGLQSQFQDIHGYTEKPCLKKGKNKQQKRNISTILFPTFQMPITSGKFPNKFTISAQLRYKLQDPTTSCSCSIVCWVTWGKVERYRKKTTEKEEMLFYSDIHFTFTSDSIMKLSSFTQRWQGKMSQIQYVTQGTYLCLLSARMTCNLSLLYSFLICQFRQRSQVCLQKKADILNLYTTFFEQCFVIGLLKNFKDEVKGY